MRKATASSFPKEDEQGHLWRTRLRRHSSSSSSGSRTRSSSTRGQTDKQTARSPIKLPTENRIKNGLFEMDACANWHVRHFFNSKILKLHIKLDAIFAVILDAMFNAVLLQLNRAPDLSTTPTRAPLELLSFNAAMI